MNKPEEQKDSKAPGHFENQGRPRQASSSSVPGREERHQEMRKMEAAQSEGATADRDREERIRHRAYRYWEEGGRQEGHAAEHWHRAAQDLDREDAEIQRTEAGGGRNAHRDRS